MRKTYTEIVLDMKTGEVLRESFFWDSREVALCKDHGQDVANQQRKDELAMQTTAFNKQMEQLDSLKGSLSKYLDGNVGFDPAALATMKSQFLNSTASNYDAAGKGVRNALLARGSAGGDAPVGGDYTRGIAALEGGKASDLSSGMMNLNLADLNQALVNKFNSASVLSGNAATLNGAQSTAGSGASNALNQYVAAKSIPGFGEIFSGALAKGLGSGVAAFATGGFGGLGSMVPTSAGGTKK